MATTTLVYTVRSNDNSVTTALPVTSTSVNQSVSATDGIGREISFDTTASDLTVTLPSVTSAGNGYHVLLRNVGTGILTVDPEGSETIDGELTVELTTDEVRWIRCDGVSWRSIADFTGLQGRAPNPNLLFNGNYSVAQRGTSFTATTSPANNDDTYLLDRWLLLSDGDDIVDVSQDVSTIPSGGFASAKLEVVTANRKFGLLQIVEARNAVAVIGQRASLSFRARAGAGNATLDTVRAAVLAWDGVADAVTSDVVSNWGIEGQNPTLVTNWAYENTAQGISLSESFQTFTIENIAIDTAGAENVAVFIWADSSSATVGDAVFISDVKLEAGQAATAYEARPIDDELRLCQRYFFQLTADAAGDEITVAAGQNANSAAGAFLFPVRMRAVPSFSSTGTAGDFNIVSSGGPTACTSAPISRSGDSLLAASIQFLATGSTAANQTSILAFSTADAFLAWDAEL